MNDSLEKLAYLKIPPPPTLDYSSAAGVKLYLSSITCNFHQRLS